MPAVGTLDQIKVGEMTSVDLQGARVGIANVGGVFYAFTDACSYEACSLSSGHLEGAILTCPCHGCRYDLTTGNVVSGPASQRVRTYRVQVEGNELRI